MPVQGIPRPDPARTSSGPNPPVTFTRKQLARTPSTAQPLPKGSPSVSGSVRSSRSVSLEFIGNQSRILNNKENSGSTSGSHFNSTEISSTPPRQTPKSHSVSAALRVATSPAISLTSPSPTGKIKPAAVTPQRSTPSKKINNAHSSSRSSAGPKSQKPRDGSGGSLLAGPIVWSPPGTTTEQSPALLSESRALLESKLADKNMFLALDDDNPFSVWDGDDMTLEMVTDVNDGNVDEEASSPPSPPPCLLTPSGF